MQSDVKCVVYFVRPKIYNEFKSVDLFINKITIPLIADKFIIGFNRTEYFCIFENQTFI